jgi:hypothetical protein
MKLLLKLLALVSTTLWILSCDSNEPQTNSTLSLTVKDVSCTEAWLQLKTTSLSLPNNITLFVNDLQYENYLINNSDTLLYIDSLLPNKNYTFKAVSFYNPEDGVNSNKINTTTLDTTSNNFSWQSWSFGSYSATSLYDVAIINENDIWAVGEILIADSVGTGYTVYNAVHWDGQSWELKKIQTLYLGNWITLPLEGIFAFSSTDIWLAGSLPIHGDGTNWTIYDIRETSGDPYLDVSRLWGSNPNDIYFVGRAGSIVHYNGSSFSKIESGTTIMFQDIYGAINQKTGEQEILAICNQNYPHYTAIYNISSNSATQISLSPIQEDLLSCWFIPNKHYYVVGSGIYEKNKLSEINWRNGPLDFTTYSVDKIRGNSLNDIFCAGAFGEILHFNGFRWHSFISELGTLDGSYGPVAMKDKIVVILGYAESQAKITMGIRN